MNEQEVRTNAAMTEMKVHCDFLQNRCVNIAAELTVATEKIKEKDARISELEAQLKE